MSYVPLTIYTVTTLNGYVKDLLDSDLALQSICVRGEVSNLSTPSSGHVYFTLKDAGSKLRAVMFRGSAIRLRFRLAEGMRVVAVGSVSVYEKSGDYQLYIEQLEPDGKGALYTAFEQLKAKLQAEGLFSVARKRPLPARPRRIAVVTSPTGAAVRDIITVSRRRWPGVNLVVVPAVVQGDQAPSSIVEAIAAANQLPEVDVIIVGRGGGSIEELWAFNEEGVARAIASSQVPVVSAVGHETDYTISDFVSDLRAPTPSGAAELVVPDMVAARTHLLQLKARLQPALSRRLETCRLHLRRLSDSWVLTEPKRMLAQKRQDVDMQCEALARGLRLQLITRRSRFTELVAGLSALSPLQVLSRGYAVCTDGHGAVLRRASSAVLGGSVKVQLGEGSIVCVVDRVEEEAMRPTGRAGP